MRPPVVVHLFHNTHFLYGNEGIGFCCLPSGTAGVLAEWKESLEFSTMVIKDPRSKQPWPVWQGMHALDIEPFCGKPQGSWGDADELCGWVRLSQVRNPPVSDQRPRTAAAAHVRFVFHLVERHRCRSVQLDVQ